MTNVKRLRVVIVGAGFAGLEAARALADFSVEILLINRDNYHTFLPLLHQVATAELQPELIAYPIRKVLRKFPNVRSNVRSNVQSNVQFVTADVKRIDLESQFVETDDCLISYDYLIVATGSTAQFFGVPGAAEYAFGLKTLKQAIILRNHILDCFEVAAHEPDETRRRQLLTFTVVGGGFTGVEFAGALAELIHGSLVKDYPTLDFRLVRVLLLHSGQNLLPGMSKRLSAYTQAQLQKMKVEVLLQRRASKVTTQRVYLHNEIAIPTSTVVWTAGVRGNSSQEWGLPTTSNGQVAVLPTLQVPGHPQVYVIGDLACVNTQGAALPMLAQVAMQQGKAVAGNITRQIKGKNPLPMRYHHLGTMAIIGRHAAVVDLGKLKLTGFVAWVLWLLVHLVSLLGFRNRILVLINWVWNYFLRDRPVCLSIINHQLSKNNSSSRLR